MIPKGLFTQIILVLIAVGIIITYIKPEFSSINETQNSIASYQEENSKVKEVNDELERQVSIIENISQDDYRNLLTYMPDEIDSIAVMRDLKFIAEDAGVVLSSVSDLGEVASDNSQNELYFAETFDPYAEPLVQDKKPTVHAFSLSVQGSYLQIKGLIDRFEQNNYPMVVSELEIKSSEGGFLDGSITINTYAFINQSENEESLVNLYE